MIIAAPATPAASVNALRAWGHASGETAASENAETSEGMANPIPKSQVMVSRESRNFQDEVFDGRQTILLKKQYLHLTRNPRRSIDNRQGATSGRDEKE